MRQLFSVSALLICSLANAQISITSADMPVAGENFYIFRDTLPTGFSIGQRGANQTWDFSNLSPDESDTTHAVAPSSTPYAADFPNANLALTNDFSGYFYYNNITSALKVEGFANNDPNLGIVSVNFSPIPDQYHFPATYLTNFSGSSGFVKAKPFNQLPPPLQAQITSALGNCPNPSATVSQVRVTFTSAYKDTIDAWGKVTTPIGTYDALRRKRIENSHTIIEVQTNCLFITQWISIQDTTNITTEHSWLSSITKLPLISLSYDGQRNITSVTYSSIPPPPIAGFTWSNQGSLVNFTNTSQNTPTAYDWDFGDGGAHSTLQSPPGHVYPANGSYYVCLTVNNVSGTDTLCDSVRVTGISTGNNPPVAVRDSVHTIYPNAVTIDALANDYDPDNGDSVHYVIFVNPANGNVTHLSSGEFEYSANANFRGVDSFEYIIRDNGNLRDTGTVVIRVDGLPFANFTFSSNNFTVQFANTSSGYDSISWDLGDGSPAETTETVVHTYTRGTYTVCLTATNSVGEDDTCKTVDLSTVSVEAIQNANIAFFPNPSNGQIRVEIGNWKLKKAEVLDLNGKILITQLATSETEELDLDIASLPSGLYLCKLTNTDGKILQGKIIKE